MLRSFALTSEAPCPRCALPLAEEDSWGVWEGKVWHGDCLQAEAIERDLDIIWR
jgi:hypothetical protein